MKNCIFRRIANQKAQKMEVKEESSKKNYGRMGCFIAAIIFIIVVVLFFTGIINFPWNE